MERIFKGLHLIDETEVTIHISHVNKDALLRIARVFSKVLRSLVASLSLGLIGNIDDDDDDDSYINNNINNSNKGNKTRLCYAYNSEELRLGFSIFIRYYILLDPALPTFPVKP